MCLYLYGASSLDLLLIKNVVIHQPIKVKKDSHPPTDLVKNNGHMGWWMIIIFYFHGLVPPFLTNTYHSP